MPDFACVCVCGGGGGGGGRSTTYVYALREIAIMSHKHGNYECHTSMEFMESLILHEIN